MALDGAMLSQIAEELRRGILHSRVDKIYQPGREELILSLRGREGAYKLLISVNAGSPRIHFTNVAVENPKSPPMFCMLLRKHLSAGKLAGITQEGLDRVLRLEFDTTNEMGDPTRLTLYVEIMGRHSNLILVDGNGRIIDAIKRVDDEMSSVRPVLPGMHYTSPPPQPEKLSLMETTADAVLERLPQVEKDIELGKRLMECLQGVSPLLCREITFFATRGVETEAHGLDEEQKTRLRFYLATLIENMKAFRCEPMMILTPEGKPKDFTFVPVRQYGIAMLTRPYESYSLLLDSFYGERDAIDRMHQRSNDLLKFLVNTSDRIARRLESQRQELLESANREQLKNYGDLLSANLYTIQKGDSEAVVVDYYQEAMPEISIPLDKRLTPVQNVQRYYGEYRKADTAEKKLTQLIVSGEEELGYIDSVFDALTRTRSEGELMAIRRELAAEGYLKNYAFKNKKEEKLPPLRFRSSDGFLILVGRNNVQNDRLTLKESRSSDIWLHTQKIPGSHTIIQTEGKPVPNRTLEEAAILAAYHSKARESSKVPVDYTPVKFVKKPGGAKPGMVIYETYQTAIVDPDGELVGRLTTKE